MNQEICTLCNRITTVSGLCQRCHSRIHQELDDLMEFWLGAHQELLPGKSGNGGRSSERTIGLNVAALSFIAGHDILGLLHEWEKLIRDQRDLTKPAFLKMPESLEQEISDAIKFAQTHLPWSGQQVWISDFSKELKEIHSQGMAAARKFVEKTRKIPCPAETDEGSCGNFLKINADDPMEIFECRRCKSEWSTLRLVAVAMSDKRLIWLDAEALAKWMGISERHIRRLAQKYNLPKRGELYEAHAMVEAHAKQA
jgi:ribosomal protein L40E